MGASGGTEKTRKLICDSFIQAYSEKGHIENISISEVCAGAGIARSTFYSYYDNTFDIMQDIQDALFRELDNIDERARQVAMEKMDYSFSPIGTLDTIRFLAANRMAFCVLLGDAGESLFRYKTMRHIKEHLKEMRNELHSTVHDPDIFFEYVGGGMISAICYWLQNRPDISPEEMASFMVSTIQANLSNESKLDNGGFTDTRKKEPLERPTKIEDKLEVKVGS